MRTSGEETVVDSWGCEVVGVEFDVIEMCSVAISLSAAVGIEVAVAIER